MGLPIPERFVEVCTDKKHMYLKKGFEFLGSFLDAYSYQWSTSEQRAPSTHQMTSHKGRGTLARIVLDTETKESALIKHYQRGGLFRRLLGDRYWCSSRFLRELSVAEAALLHGVPTAEILALVIERNGFLYCADLVTREIPGAIDLGTYLAQNSSLASQSDRGGRIEGLLSAVAGLLRTMHAAGIFHADLNVKNILVQEADDSLRCYVIDLDRARLRPLLRPSERIKNLKRLYRSLEKTGLIPDHMTEGHLSRFVELYCEKEPEMLLKTKKLLGTASLSLRFHRLLWRLTRGNRK